MSELDAIPRTRQGRTPVIAVERATPAAFALRPGSPSYVARQLWSRGWNVGAIAVHLRCMVEEVEAMLFTRVRA